MTLDEKLRMDSKFLCCEASMVETDSLSSHGIFIAGAVGNDDRILAKRRKPGEGGQLHNTSEVFTHKKPNPKTM